MNNNVIHGRLGHASDKLITEAIKKNLIQGIRLPNTYPSSCEICLKAKAHRRPNPREIRAMIPERVKKPKDLGEVLVADASSPFVHPSILEKNTYIFIILDVASGYLFDFYTNSVTTDFVMECLNKVIAFIGSYNARVCHFHSDGTSSIINDKFRKHLIQNCITWSFSSPYTPEENGIVERSFRTIKERALALLTLSNLPSSFWEFACKMAVHIQNKLPKNLLSGFKSPYQFIHGSPADLSYLRTFGCRVIATINSSSCRNDWSPKWKLGIFVGYRDDGAGYVIYNPAIEKTFISSHVYFEEDKLYLQQQTNEQIKNTFLKLHQPKSLEDYNYLTGTVHVDPDNGIKYIITRISTKHGFIVGYRAEYKQGLNQEIDDPIHVKDLQSYTAQYDILYSKKRKLNEKKLYKWKR